jgi:hypothetical protein
MLMKGEGAGGLNRCTRQTFCGSGARLRPKLARAP